MFRPFSSVSALQADAHAVEAELGALYRQVQSLESLFQGHVPVGLVLELVARLHERVQQARYNRVFVHALDQVYYNTKRCMRLMVAIESLYLGNLL